MSEEEFEVLDELYFVTSFEELTENCDLLPARIVEVLQQLHQQELIKVLSSVDQEVPFEKVNVKDQHASYLYLASKKGLLAHNSK